MDDLAYEKYLDPTSLSKEELGDGWYTFSDLIGYGGNGGELADVIPYHEGLISSLRRRYTFRDDIAVEGFLRKNQFLIQLLFSAFKEIRKHFDGNPRLALEVSTDPEATGDQQLFVIIRTRFRPKIARAILSDLDQGWWLGALPAAQGKMEFSLEYLKEKQNPL